ncbi:MAG: histidine phosphatase family protein [Bacillota bacterium]
MIIYLFRHGETAGNKLRKYIGKTDECVSQCGIEELKSKGKTAVDMLFVSPRKRCLQTAEILIACDSEKVVEEKLAECDFGDFENKSYIDLENDKNYIKWVENNCRGEIPNGESMESFSQRTTDGFYACLAKACKAKAKEIAIVCHGGSIMAIMTNLFGGDFYSHMVKNGECVKLQMTCNSGEMDFEKAER